MPVSVIIPAYNEAMRLPGSLPPLVSVMRKIPDAEVIVVDDGSTDGTAAVAEEHLAGMPGGRVLRLPWNSGKGAAVRAGVSVAHGASIVFMDADGASDVNDLPLLLAALEHAEVALGSRRIGDGAVRSSGRRVGSWAFNQITRSLASLDVADTQCGFKAFRGQEAKLLFSLARSSGFGFDVEVLSIARSIGYRIAEVPIRWAEIPGGTFRVTRHTPAMIVDVVRARRYLGRAAPGLVVSTPARPPAAGAPAGPAAATPPVAAADQPGTAARREPGPAGAASPVVPAKPALAVPPGSPGSAGSAGSVRRAPLSPPRRPRPEAVQPAAARRVDPAPDARGAGPSRTDLVVLESVAAAAAGRTSDDGGAGLILPGTTMGLPNPGVSRLASPGGARALSGGTVDEPVVTIPSPGGEPGIAAAAARAAALTAPVGGGDGSVFPASERDGAARSS
ncbi:dolichyl-phosphate beta-glucosyltransferase [Frankia gtarii]|uniref:dolichyl-phosphate beta-glucosyltransferase n=1 Tax=Frankia gtarii TaxID=2950102 RepID=UPI0021BE8530|nr:dolichyl-phosphate beta-glucosyltransferase [Frankia gtarii]